MVTKFFSLFPDWYIAACLIVGNVVFPIMIFLAARPLLRGLSYGLWETVVYYKAGCGTWAVVKRFMWAVLFDLFFWSLANQGTQEVSKGGACWTGLFGWYFRKEFTRANSVIKNQRAAQKENVQ